MTKTPEIRKRFDEAQHALLMLREAIKVEEPELAGQVMAIHNRMNALASDVYRARQDLAMIETELELPKAKRIGVEPARLDADKSAKPKTRLLTRVKADGRCVVPGPATVIEEVGSGKRTALHK